MSGAHVPDVHVSKTIKFENPFPNWKPITKISYIELDINVSRLVIHLWSGQPDALCDPNYVWCNPQTVSRPTQCAVWHGGLDRPGSAGV